LTIHGGHMKIKLLPVIMLVAGYQYIQANPTSITIKNQSQKAQTFKVISKSLPITPSIQVIDLPSAINRAEDRLLTRYKVEKNAGTTILASPDDGFESISIGKDEHDLTPYNDKITLVFDGEKFYYEQPTFAARVKTAWFKFTQYLQAFAITYPASLTIKNQSTTTAFFKATYNIVDTTQDIAHEIKQIDEGKQYTFKIGKNSYFKRIFASIQGREDKPWMVFAPFHGNLTLLFDGQTFKKEPSYTQRIQKMMSQFYIGRKVDVTPVFKANITPLKTSNTPKLMIASIKQLSGKTNVISIPVFGSLKDIAEAYKAELSRLGTPISDDDEVDIILAGKQDPELKYTAQDIQGVATLFAVIRKKEGSTSQQVVEPAPYTASSNMSVVIKQLSGKTDVISIPVFGFLKDIAEVYKAELRRQGTPVPDDYEVEIVLAGKGDPDLKYTAQDIHGVANLHAIIRKKQALKD